MQALMLFGRSTRLKDKPFIKIRGKELFRHGYETLAGIFDRVLIVANESVADKTGKLGIDYITEDLGAGPAGAIVAGLKNLTSDYVFVAACDMPFINDNVVRFMVDRVEGDGLFPRHENGDIEPLHGIYRRKPFIGVGIPEDRRVRTMIESLDVSYIQVEELRRFDRRLLTFRNINTQEDIRWMETLS